MRLMTDQTVLVKHAVTVPEMATETGRHADMSAVTGDTVPIVRTDIGRHLRVNLLVTTGTDRTAPTHLGKIIPKRLVRVMAIDTAAAGKMRVIVWGMTTGTRGENILSRRVVLMTIDTTDL